MINHALNGAQIIFQLHQQNVRRRNGRFTARNLRGCHGEIGTRIDGNHVLGVIPGHVNQRISGGFVFAGEQRNGIKTGFFQMSPGKETKVVVSYFANIVHPGTGAQRGGGLISPFASRPHHAVLRN